MDNKYRIMITDRETGRRADHGDLPGQVDTGLGMIVAQGGKDEQGSAWFCAVLADGSGTERRDLVHMADAVFNAFHKMGADCGHPQEVFSAVCLAFTKWVKNEIPNAAARVLLFQGLAALERAEAAGQ